MAKAAALGVTQERQGKKHDRILVVDDDPDFLDALRELLGADDNLEVRTASNAFQARRLVAVYHPDVVLLDVHLGDSSGLNLIPWLKREHQPVVCIVMTGYTNAAYPISAIRSGADDFLVKPIEPDNLKHVIDRHLHDITALKSSQQRQSGYQTAFNNSHNLYFVLDDAGLILDLNPIALDYVQQSKSEILNRALWDVPWCGKEPGLSILFKETIARTLSGEPATARIGLRNKQGDMHSFTFCFTPIKDSALDVGILVEAGFF